MGVAHIGGGAYRREGVTRMSLVYKNIGTVRTVVVVVVVVVLQE